MEAMTSVSVSPVPGFDRVAYSGPSQPPHPLRVCSLFVPGGATPPAGWPLVVAVNLSGFHTSWVEPVIDGSTPPNGAFFAGLLDAGFAVLVAAVTVARSPSTLDDPAYKNPHTDTEFSIDSPNPRLNHYGAAYTGNGIWASPDLPMPADFSGSVHPYADVRWPMAHKDCVALLQFVLQHAATMQVDVTRLVAYGSSAAAVAQSWVALGDERAVSTWGAEAAGQELLPTRGRYAAVVLEQMPWHWPLFDQGLLAPDFVPWHMATPGNANPKFDAYDRGAFQLGFPNPFGVSADVQAALSPSAWTTTGAAQSVVQGTPTWLAYEALDEGGPPYDTSHPGDVLLAAHGVWSGVALAQALNVGQLRFVADAAVRASIHPGVTDPLHLPVVVPAAQQVADRISWLGGLLGASAGFQSGEVGPLGGPKLAPGGSLGSTSKTPLVQDPGRRSPGAHSGG